MTGDGDKRDPANAEPSAVALQRAAEHSTGAANDGDWDAPQRSGGLVDTDGDGLVVDVDGFSGPLDLLLALARTQKVDLTQISILMLVDQYLEFIAEARRVRLELAGDYLVMASWLAFLKSKLLLPKPDADGAETLSGEELARRLAFRLKRLEAMRNAGETLMRRPRMGLAVFSRGRAEPVKTVRNTVYSAEIYDLLKAYADRRRRSVKRQHVVRARPVWSIMDARERIERLFRRPAAGEWVQLDLFLDQMLDNPSDGRTALAASFGASLEMAREGTLELRQDKAFAPLMLRRPVRQAASGGARMQPRNTV